MSLAVRTRREGDLLVAHLSGDLDREADAALAGLERELAGAAGLVLDFADTAFITSSGLALLVRLARAAQGEGMKVSAVALSEHYRHVFDITQLDTVILVRDDVQAAMAAMSGGGRG